ncbi:protein MIS12 [Tanacetum coccineum]
MEGSESEAIFDSLNLNPQFINATLNIVDELIDSGFTHLHSEVLAQLKIEGSKRAEDLTKGLDYIRYMIQSSLDKRLSMWEKYYCFLHIFTVPEGFSLLKDDEASAGDLMDVDAVGNSDLDAQLDSLRTQLALAEQESAGLKKEIQMLERQSVINIHQAALMNDVTKLSDQISADDAFKEVQIFATELHKKLKKVNTGRAGDIERLRLERMRLCNVDPSRMISGNVLVRTEICSCIARTSPQCCRDSEEYMNFFLDLLPSESIDEFYDQKKTLEHDNMDM